MSVTIDPYILASFGEPPDGLNIKEQRYVLYNVIVSVFLGLAVVAVAVRLYVRKIKGSGLWFDDHAIILSTICASGTVAMTILAGNHGAGTHIWVNKLTRLMTLLKIVYIEPYIYALTVTATKMSILLFYRRLFYSHDCRKDLFFILYWGAFILAAIYPFILWITMACACRPVSYYWNQYIGAEGYCIDVKLFFLVLGVLNMLNDIIILIVPIPRIVELQLSRRLKASVIGIMFLGGFVCIASIVRIYYLFGLFSNLDSTWWVGSATAWSSIEPSVAIISACLPTLAPLFRVNRPTRHESSPYYGTERTDAARLGTQFTKNLRSGGRLGLHSSMRTNVLNFTIDDDEVELTCKVAAGDSVSSRELENRRVSEEERGIVVRTDVTIVSSDRTGFHQEKVKTPTREEMDIM